MSSDDAHTSGSDQLENSVQIRSTVSSSVHLVNYKRNLKVSTTEIIYADDSHSTTKQRETSDSHRERSSRTKRMEFLPEVDEELDYNEDELPSLTRREITPVDARHKVRGTVLSPREEGEEYSEEDDESYSQPEVRREKSGKLRSRPDREEGEASSEEDRRYRRHRQQQKQLESQQTRTQSSRHASSLSTAVATTSNIDLLLDEAHYRHRLQERYERREAKRSKNISTDVQQDERSLSSTRTGKSSSSQAQFLAPRSKIDLSPNANSDAINPTGPAPSEQDRRWHISRSSSSDKARHRIPDEASGLVDQRLSEERKSSRKHEKSEKKFSDHMSSRSKRPDHDVSPSDLKSERLLHSYSTSILGYEQETAEEEQRFRTDLRHSERESSKKTKSKKSKRDRADKEERREQKKSSKVPKPQSYPQLDYGNWEGSKLYDSLYENPLSEVTKASRNRSTDKIDYGSDSTGSTSRSSSYSASHLEAQDSSSSRKHRSRHGALTGSNPDAAYMKTKHKHHYHRDTRESAPPPDTLRSQGMPESEAHRTRSQRDYKTDKHKLEETRSGGAQLPQKRSRKSLEVEENAAIVRRSDSRSRLTDSDSQEKRALAASRLPSGMIPTSEQVFETESTAKQGPTRPMRMGIAGYPHSASSSNSSRSGSTHSVSRDRSGDEQTNDDPEHDRMLANRDRSQSLSKRTTAPSTLRPGPYRLYSESESEEDDVDNMVDDTRKNGDARHNLNGIDDNEIGASTELHKSPVPSKPFYFPSIQGCRSVEEFECLNRIEEGTYGVVYRARDKKTNEIVALKRLKMEKERDGFPITSLREINTLMKAQHENIVTVREIVVGSNMDKIYLVMDYVEHDLKSLMEIMNGPFSVGEVKCLLVQLLRAVRHLHDNWILHRDLKTSNLLLSHQGILKVGDFGLAREYGSPLKHYTEVVVTLWYRAPELLLGIKQYTCPIDLWSVGCIFAEFLLQRPLFPGKGEVDELNIIFRDLGTPTERIWPGVSQLPGMKKCVFTDYPYNQLRRRFTEKQISDQGFDLLNSFLTYCPEKRITADKALGHAYFNERPRAIHPSMFPSWPAKSEGAITATRKASPRPPAGGGALAAAAAALASAGSSGPGGRVRYQPPAPPMGGQRFYSSMGVGGGADSRPGTAIGSGDMLSSGPDKGFLLRF